METYVARHDEVSGTSSLLQFMLFGRHDANHFGMYLVTRSTLGLDHQSVVLIFGAQVRHVTELRLELQRESLRIPNPFVQ